MQSYKLPRIVHVAQAPLQVDENASASAEDPLLAIPVAFASAEAFVPAVAFAVPFARCTTEDFEAMALELLASDCCIVPCFTLRSTWSKFVCSASSSHVAML